MKALHVIIEPGRDGFGVMFTIPEFKGITSFGETLEEAKENARIVLKDMIEYYVNKGEEIPEHLKSIHPDTVKMRYTFFLKYYFELFPYINLSQLAKKIGLNPSLMRQYVKGLSYSSEEQYLKIRNGLHVIGKELTVV